MSNYSELNYYLKDTGVYTGTLPAPAQHPNYLNGWHYSGNIATEQLIVFVYDNTGATDNYTLGDINYLGVKVRIQDVTQAKNPLLIIDTEPQGDGNDYSPGVYRSRYTYNWSANQFYANEDILLYVIKDVHVLPGDLRRFSGVRTSVGPNEQDEVIQEIRFETDSTEASCDLILINSYMQTRGTIGNSPIFQRQTNYYPYQNNNQLCHGLASNDQVYPFLVNTSGELAVTMGAVPTGTATEATLLTVQTSVELIDDTVMVMGTDNYSEAVSKGLLVGAVRNDTQATLASTNKDITPLQVDTNGGLYCSVYGTSLTDIELNTDYGSVIGGGVEASALRVTLASDSTGVLSVDDNGGSLTVDNAGAFGVDIAKTPVVGSQGNLSSAVTTAGTDEKSSVVNTIYTPNISVFGNIDNACVITLQASIDNTNFYNTTSSYTSVGAEDFFFSVVSSAQYHRLNYSAATITVTATLCAV
jgi:hypothetical protein